jgi:hypothetical protein
MLLDGGVNVLEAWKSRKKVEVNSENETVG